MHMIESHLFVLHAYIEMCIPLITLHIRHYIWMILEQYRLAFSFFYYRNVKLATCVGNSFILIALCYIYTLAQYVSVWLLLLQLLVTYYTRDIKR